MSSHPNVILMAVLTPDDASRRTMRAIRDEIQSSNEEIVIDGKEYYTLVMEGDYDAVWQISAAEGDLVFFDLVTYGYGDVIEWSVLEQQKNALEVWAKGVSERHQCSYAIRVTANYW